MEKNEWLLLRYVCGWDLPESKLEALWAVSESEMRGLLEAVERFPTFTDPRAMALYEKGVVEGGIARRLGEIDDPDLAEAASVLLERLHEFGQEMMEDTPSADLEADLRDGLFVKPKPVSATPSDTEIQDMLLDFGWDPSCPAVQHESLIDYCRSVFEKALGEKPVKG